MDIKIYGGGEQKQSVHLRLFYADDTVFLAAVDPGTGEKIGCGNLVAVFPSGKIRRIGSVNKGLGFELDERGRIKLDEGLK